MRRSAVIGLAAVACASTPQMRTPNIRMPEGWEVAITEPVTCDVGQRDCGGWTRPAVVDECSASISVPREISWHTWRVGFAIAEDGSVSDVRPSDKLPPDVASSIRSWLASCRFVPARDPAHGPAPVRALQRVRFVDPPWGAAGSRSAPQAPSCAGADAGLEPSLGEGEPFPSGWSTPRSEPDCVQKNVATRLGRRWAGADGNVTVKFAVQADGRVGRFRVLTEGVPDRLSCALWESIQACNWTPGADAEGRPTAMWVVIPLRFVSR